MLSHKLKRPLCIGMAFLIGLALLCQAAQAGGNRIDRVRPDAPELAAYGPWPIGVRTLQLVNPKQLDIVKAKAGDAMPVYDRPLTIEVWYPALPPAVQPARLPGVGATDLAPGEYRVVPRDPRTTVLLRGKALRDASPDARGGPYPLLIISHGYPGNRYLMSPLAENLASKGYVVAAIDHTDSTYSDQALLASTLFNRSLDQLFVLNAMDQLDLGQHSDAASGALNGMVNTRQTGLIGYSMGGLGVLNAVGAGFSAAAVKSPLAPPGDVLARRQAGHADYLASIDARIKAVIAIAPWGWNAGMWDAAGLAGMRTPILYMAGSLDDVSGYAPGVRNLFDHSINAPRYLLTFENANHSAAAPMPPPAETWARVPHLPIVPAEHYIDPVWDNVRMNNIAQHFAAAFLGRYLRNDVTMDGYLNLVERSRDGKWSVESDGRFKSDHSFWKGFQPRTAAGLRLEFRKPAVP